MLNVAGSLSKAIEISTLLSGPTETSGIGYGRLSSVDDPLHETIETLEKQKRQNEKNILHLKNAQSIQIKNRELNDEIKVLKDHLFVANEESKSLRELLDESEHQIRELAEELTKTLNNTHAELTDLKNENMMLKEKLQSVKKLL